MSSLINAFREVLRNEAKTEAFYRLASDITHDGESRMVFLELSQIEENHARELIEMARHVPFEEGWDPASYLEEAESLVHATIPNDELNAILDGDMKKVLGIAHHLEERTLNTYRSLAEVATDAEARRWFSRLADREEHHLAEVERLTLALEMPEEDRAAL
jgi:rubrerythrin